MQDGETAVAANCLARDLTRSIASSGIGSASAALTAASRGGSRLSKSAGRCSSFISNLLDGRRPVVSANVAAPCTTPSRRLRGRRPRPRKSRRATVARSGASRRPWPAGRAVRARAFRSQSANSPASNSSDGSTVDILSQSRSSTDGRWRRSRSRDRNVASRTSKPVQLWTGPALCNRKASVNTSCDTSSASWTDLKIRIATRNTRARVMLDNPVPIGQFIIGHAICLTSRACQGRLLGSRSKRPGMTRKRAELRICVHVSIEVFGIVFDSGLVQHRDQFVAE